ncbi:hypothetical protein DJ568_06675 [Mucilaginibacter hurinus]|uniref:Uncharacterized protein n=1 Tax=Mucilaginibacter hurinus TaxID=2201324 RepID=A0A367GS60_9SPHI|nr:hypothetical protein [Mucilaginibacter hurinus]RCH55571.1 hypothetical protein DJ568_06675 [Mucilaginibacter hurinus]
MKVENPAAFRFIMQDDLYLLPGDMLTVSGASDTENVPAPISPPVIETQKPAFNYMGNNRQHFLVLVFYPAHEFMHDAHLTALTNTLSRKGLDIADVAILNLSNCAEAAFAEIVEQLSPKKVLILGNDILPADLPALTLNKPELVGAILMLKTFGFGEMMDSNDKKKAFWEQVKNF